MKNTFLVCFVLCMITFLGCKEDPYMYGMSAPYNVNFYIDTIADHVILTTVCNNSDNTCLSTNSISLGKVDTTELKSKLWKK